LGVSQAAAPQSRKDVLRNVHSSAREFHQTPSNAGMLGCHINTIMGRFMQSF